MTLALFFTWRVSLQLWADKGMLERELALYNKLAMQFDHIYLFTYGDESDHEYSEYLPSNISIIPKSRVSNNLLYSFLCPLIHYRTLRKVDLLKTNQMLGSWTAMVAKTLYWTPLIIRTGFVLSLFYAKRKQPLPLRLLAITLEFFAYIYADGIITSSPHGYKFVENRYVVRGIHKYIPNYVEIDRFTPMNVTKKSSSICYVGRLDEQKNLISLLKSIASSNYSLTIVGSGELETALHYYAECLDIKVTFRGNLPNTELPPLINRHMIFVLPSHFEGMPKTLLEAMACGVPVIGTDVQGINEVITDGNTGILCDTDKDSIRLAIDYLFEDADRRQILARRARADIETKFSLEKVLSQEISLYETILSRTSELV
jgi:glycosyltransferase involved in cell wall biosynthesis